MAGADGDEGGPRFRHPQFRVRRNIHKKILDEKRRSASMRSCGLLIRGEGCEGTFKRGNARGEQWVASEEDGEMQTAWDEAAEKRAGAVCWRGSASKLPPSPQR